MIGMHLPPVLRSLHEATGVSIWIATFALAYLARIGERCGASARRAPTWPSSAPFAPADSSLRAERQGFARMAGRACRRVATELAQRRPSR